MFFERYRKANWNNPCNVNLMTFVYGALLARNRLRGTGVFTRNVRTPLPPCPYDQRRTLLPPCLGRHGSKE